MTDEVKDKQDTVIYDIDPKYISDQGCLQLSGELFYKWKAYDAAHESAKTKLELAQQKLDFELRRPENERIRNLLITRENTMKEVSETSVHLKSAIDDISNVIKIDIRGCSVDDVTGTVHKWNDEDHKDVPILASSEPAPIQQPVEAQQPVENTDDIGCCWCNNTGIWMDRGSPTACGCKYSAKTETQTTDESSPQELENALLERINNVVKSFKEDLLKLQK